MEIEVSRAIVRGFAEKLEASLDIDVAIVGAGPSGLVCACELAGKGFKVSLFERKLAPGGGIWGGAMLNNEIVVQEELSELMKHFGVRYKKAGKGLLRVDSVEIAAALIYRAVHAGAKLFNGMTVEDVVYKKGRIGGVVINWTPVLLENMHVDPLIVCSRVVLDSTGHNALLTEKVARKAGIRLATATGGIMGEKPMWMEKGEQATVKNTARVYPGLYVSGMAANGVFGAARMGPIFGGMFLSGLKAAKLIARELAKQPS
jgi:sulfide-dependent adenosine diphosphate thiazole synthase